MTNAWHGFNPAKHKRGLLALLIIGLAIGLYSWAEQPGNSLFHSMGANPNFQDPIKPLWYDCLAGGNAWQFGTLTSAVTGTCNSSQFQFYLNLQPNSTTNAVVLSRNAITIDQASSKVLEFDQIIATSTGNTISPSTEIYLTRNGTLPTYPQVKTYDPYSDPNVVFITKISENSIDSAGTFFTYMQTDPAKSIKTTDNGCPSGGSVYNCVAFGNFPLNQLNLLNLQLNYTGATFSSSLSNFNLWSCPGLPCTSIVTSTSVRLPNLSLSSQYYLGYYVQSAGVATDGVAFYGSTEPPNPNPNSNNQLNSMVFSIFTPNPPSTPPPQFVDTGGFFGPVIKALINIGIFILNSILGFVAFIAPAIQAALNFLETQIINLLNIIGNALGFGNVGTDLSTVLTNLITFFTNNSYGLPAFFGFFGTYFTNFLRWLQIDFQFIGPIFNIANAILIFGVNGIAEAITIITIGLQMLLFGYGTFTLFAYFLYVGDDGIGGLFTYLGTLEAISFKILNSIVIVTNLGIDFLVMMVSLIPKPFIQMNAARIPRLPTIESNSTMSFPALDFGEARNGNLIVYWLWCMGLWFLCWFESQNPALPGSIVALDPALATNVRLLSNFIPLMQAATLVSGGLVVIWFCMLPMRLAGIDVTEAPLGASLGRRTGPGPSSVHISGGKKHLVGPAKRAEKEKQLGQVKKEEQAKQAIEKAKKAEEEKKRSEELRKRELERKPTGKDLRGPNLQ